MVSYNIKALLFPYENNKEIIYLYKVNCFDLALDLTIIKYFISYPITLLNNANQNNSNRKLYYDYTFLSKSLSFSIFLLSSYSLSFELFDVRFFNIDFKLFSLISNSSSYLMLSVFNYFNSSIICNNS